MPDRYEAEDDPDVVDFVLRAAQWNEEVTDKPLVESSMPLPPKVLKAVVVAHTAPHVLRALDSVAQGPQSEESPDGSEFEPDPF